MDQITNQGKVRHYQSLGKVWVGIGSELGLALDKWHSPMTIMYTEISEISYW